MSKKILIVDDDLESLKLVGLMLQRRGFDIISAHTGRQALKKAETERPDLVILDIMMPDFDGYKVCEQLRSKPNTANLPVIMFTAKTLIGDKVAGFEAGADDYLTKPIHPSDLVSHVEALLERAEQIHEEATTLDRGRVVGVLGAKGGVGASTLLVNLAVATSQHGPAAQGHNGSNRVSIVDLRMGQGTVALLLGRAPVGGWATLADKNSDDLDHETVDSQLLSYDEGVRYFPASLQPEGERSSLAPMQVDTVLNRIRATADYLFLDLGSVLDAATCQAIALCDVIIVVVEPEHLCLMLAKALMDNIVALDAAPDDVRVVLVERQSTDATYSPEEIREVLGRELAGVIQPAPLITRQATEQGRPLVLSHPESEIAEQFRQLSRTLQA